MNRPGYPLLGTEDRKDGVRFSGERPPRCQGR
jgi:hypothetical protein